MFAPLAEALFVRDGTREVEGTMGATQAASRRAQAQTLPMEVKLYHFFGNAVMSFFCVLKHAAKLRAQLRGQFALASRGLHQLPTPDS